eukprot:scaffold1220_cov259-Pinguiococcus_pyrenoidosus.AAC.6
MRTTSSRPWTSCPSTSSCSWGTTWAAWWRRSLPRGEINTCRERIAERGRRRCALCTGAAQDLATPTETLGRDRHPARVKSLILMDSCSTVRADMLLLTEAEKGGPVVSPRNLPFAHTPSSLQAERWPCRLVLVAWTLISLSRPTVPRRPERHAGVVGRGSEPGAPQGVPGGAPQARAGKGGGGRNLPVPGCAGDLQGGPHCVRADAQ